MTWPRPEVRQKLLTAAEKKNDLIDLVTSELEHSMCSEVIDLRGPITVNGVPQGPSTLTIDTSCTKPVDSVYVDIPQAVIEQFSAGGTATATVEDGGELLKVGVHGAKSGEVGVQTSPTWFRARL
jgi:hypothetical protein